MSVFIHENTPAFAEAGLYGEAYADGYSKLDEMEEHVDGGYKDREVYFPEMIELWQWENHPPLQELYDSFNYDRGGC